VTPIEKREKERMFVFRGRGEKSKKRRKENGGEGDLKHWHLTQIETKKEKSWQVGRDDKGTCVHHCYKKN